MLKNKINSTSHFLIFLCCLIMASPYFLGAWAIHMQNENNEYDVFVNFFFATGFISLFGIYFIIAYLLKKHYK